MYRDKKWLSILKIKEGERNNASGFVEGLLVVSDYDILAIEGIRLDFSIDFLTYYIGFKSINQFEITKQRLLKSHVYIIDNNEE